MSSCVYCDVSGVRLKPVKMGPYIVKMCEKCLKRKKEDEKKGK